MQLCANVHTRLQVVFDEIKPLVPENDDMVVDQMQRLGLSHLIVNFATSQMSYDSVRSVSLETTSKMINEWQLATVGFPVEWKSSHLKSYRNKPDIITVRDAFYPARPVEQ